MESSKVTNQGPRERVPCLVFEEVLSVELDRVSSYRSHPFKISLTSPRIGMMRRPRIGTALYMSFYNWFDVAHRFSLIHLSPMRVRKSVWSSDYVCALK